MKPLKMGIVSKPVRMLSKLNEKDCGKISYVQFWFLMRKHTEVIFLAEYVRTLWKPAPIMGLGDVNNIHAKGYLLYDTTCIVKVC
jgi:hypothetical protein